MSGVAEVTRTRPVVPPTVRIHRRRLVSASIMAAAVGLVIWLTLHARQNLGDPSTLTGWTLVAGMVAMIAIGARRRLPGVVAGSMSTWTQVHLYTGGFMVAVFVLHVPAIVGNGRLEATLSIAFWIVSLGGVHGLFISRTYPRRIRLSGGATEDRVDLAGRAAELMNQTDDPLTSHYQSHLRSYFDSETPLRWFWKLSTRSFERRLFLLKSLYRYLDAEGRQRQDAMTSLVRRRDALDYCVTLRRRLRAWVVVHVISTVVLIVAAAIHVWSVWEYRGG